jgi:hypothetical protein
MSFISELVGDLSGANAQADAATQAAQTQAASSAAGIAETRRQFDALQAALAPYTNAGVSGLAGQKDLLGLNGNGAQQTAINGITNGAEYKSMLQQGENSILTNASATGGLRGGNTQAALAQFSPALLSQLINDQYSKLGGLTSIGQNAAAGTGNAGMQTASSISSLLQQQGAATAGGQIAQGNAQASNMSNLFKLGGSILGMF